MLLKITQNISKGKKKMPKGGLAKGNDDEAEMG
jgi:hypothetical protein